MASPEHHRFSVALVDFACEELDVTEGNCEPYLRLDFDNFKVFKTDHETNTRSPGWGFKAGFQYKTRFLEKLAFRKFRIQCFDKLSPSHEPLGEAEVDLQTIACGPAYFRLTLRDTQGQGRGFVTFICVMKMISRNLAVSLQELQLTMQGSPAPARLIISTTLCENVVEVPFCPDGEWNTHFSLVLETTLGDMLKAPDLEFLRVQVLDMHSMNQGQAMLAFRDIFTLGKAPLPFRVPVTYSGETQRADSQSGLFQSECANFSGAVGELTGSLTYQALPVYAQMAGGLCNDGAIEGGHLLIEGLPHPRSMSQPPPVWRHQADGDVETLPASGAEETINLSTEELVKALELIEPPAHWEIKKDLKSGRQYFADARHRRTTWVDPRFLPDNWDQRIDAATGRLYFAYHKTRKTTYIDPRYCPDGWDMRISKAGDVYFAHHPAMKTTYQDPRGLPEDFEACLDDLGRMYFRDHNTKSTTWEDPRTGQPDQVLRKWKKAEWEKWTMNQVSSAVKEIEHARLLDHAGDDTDGRGMIRSQTLEH